MTINGLPAHPLLVHLVVVLVPLTALAALVVTVWPAAQRKLTFLVPLGALVGLAFVPVTVSAGRSLESTLRITPALQKHADFGGKVLPWVLGLALTTVVQYVVIRRGLGGRAVLVVVGALEVVAAVGSLVIVVLTGDSGAHALWGR